MAKRDVFISYKSEDYETASWVRSVLETNGITCWMAPQDIPGGSNYAAEIPAAITQARVFVIILSAKTQESTWIPKEIDLAMNRGKVIMPFMLEPFQLRDDFNFYLSNVQRYEAFEGKTKAISRMVKEIKALLGVSEAEGANPAVRTPAEPVKASRKREQAVITTACVLLLAGLLAFLFWPKGINNDGQPAEPAGQETAEAVSVETDGEGGAAGEDIQDEHAGQYHIIVSASDNVGFKDYNEAKEILRERLNVFTGGEDYGWNDDGKTGGKVDIYLPKEYFAGHTVQYVLDAYLIRSINLYAMDLESKAYIPVLRSDLESVATGTGSIPGVDASQYGITEPKYRFIIIRLNDDFIAKHREEYSSWKQFAFAQDVEENLMETIYNYYTFPTGDGKTFYVLNNDAGERFSELVVHNLTNRSLAEQFVLRIDLDSCARWEDPQETAWRGENQCGAGAFTAPTVTFTIQYGAKITPVEMVSAETVLKQRLDALGTPYAVGKGDDGTGDTKLFVKTTLEHTGLPVMELLSGSGTMTLKSDSLVHYFSQKSFTVGKRTDQRHACVFTGNYDSQTEALKLFARCAAEKGEEHIFLYIRGDPLLACSTAEAAETGTLVFDQLCGIRDGKITRTPMDESHEWLADFLRAFCETDDPPGVTSLESRELNAGADGTVPAAADYGAGVTVNNDGLRRTVRTLYTDADVTYDNGTLNVFLNLPADADLPEKAVDGARQVFEIMEREKVQADGIMVMAAREEPARGERARIFFSKTFGSLKTGEDGQQGYSDSYYNVFVLFRNGRMASYKDRVWELIRGSEFYQQFSENLMLLD